MIGVVNLDPIAFDKIGWKDHQVGAAGMTQRWKQDAAKRRGDDQIGEFPRWRYPPVDAGNLPPGTVPFPPGAVPGVRVEPLRKVGDFGKRDLVGGKRCRRGDAGAVSVFFECRLRRT